MTHPYPYWANFGFPHFGVDLTSNSDTQLHAGQTRSCFPFPSFPQPALPSYFFPDRTSSSSACVQFWKLTRLPILPICISLSVRYKHSHTHASHHSLSTRTSITDQYLRRFSALATTIFTSLLTSSSPLVSIPVSLRSFPFRLRQKLHEGENQ